MAGSGGSSVQRPKQTMTNEQIYGYLRNRLHEYNARDTKAIDRHIRGLRGILESGGNNVLQPDLTAPSPATSTWTA